MSDAPSREPRCVGCGGKPWISLSMVGWICEDCYDARGISGFYAALSRSGKGAIRMSRGNSDDLAASAYVIARQIQKNADYQEPDASDVLWLAEAVEKLALAIKGDLNE